MVAFPSFHRSGDAGSSQAEQQVLLTRSQLEDIRRQVANDLRATNTFLLYHLEELANGTKDEEEEAQVIAVLAETEDRNR